jgi:hypothetical protein
VGAQAHQGARVRITTDPLAQAKWANERQAALGNYYKRRVRMLKRWNDEHSGRLDSYHLEVIVGNAFTSMGNDSRDALAKFFAWAPSYLHVQDPAGHSGDLGGELTYQSTQAILESFASSRGRADKANQAEIAGDHREAIRLWRIVLDVGIKQTPNSGTVSGRVRGSPGVPADS